MAKVKAVDRKRLEGFERFLKGQMKRWKVPGVGVGIIKNGEVLMAEGFGYGQLNGKVPATATTIFAICSCSKAFTTMLMGMLVDEGKLDWNRPVREYLPEFALKDRFASERLTPLDLVTHRSGLPRHDSVWYGSPDSREALIGRLRYLEPTADLRVRYQYQNMMYMTAGYLVGRLTDSSWEEQVRTRIFAPLGMEASTLSVADSMADETAARPHEEVRGKLVEIPYRNLDAVAPAGAINSNIGDMLKWVGLHLEGGCVGKKRLISKEQLKKMHSAQIPCEEGADEEFRFSSYGLGWSVQAYRGHRMLSHSGGIDGFACLTTFLPDDGIGVVVLTNRAAPLPGIATWNAVDRLLGLEEVPWSRRIGNAQRKGEREQKKRRRKELAGRVKGTKPSHPLEAYAGEYEHPGYGRLSVRVKGKRLMAVYHAFDGEAKAEHFHYDVFEVKPARWGNGFKATFASDAKGEIVSVSLPLQEEVEEILFKRVEG